MEYYREKPNNFAVHENISSSLATFFFSHSFVWSCLFVVVFFSILNVTRIICEYVRGKENEGKNKVGGTNTSENLPLKPSK